MPINLQETQAPGLKQSEAVLEATTSVVKGLQAVAAAMTDYWKTSSEKSRALFEKLLGVKHIDEAIQLQSDFAKAAYEDFIAQATTIGNLYSDLAKQAFQPSAAAPPAQPPLAAPPAQPPVAAPPAKATVTAKQS
ncbi:phasin family protein (plasmid) [Methylocystis sp. MJC1]|jgi:hypothetical protein|uniref:phasin family protein n=1 Tax=Methylocystis sp. MJC1 TaxID=2654282 RepID=UPI0013E9C8D5|nr:phasin family protein [Methylocystis sp. MJC1]KAF2988674.1 hypothetical protein MJC1_04248 [Methylocystis sp. MJC1]MBU6529285.1 phasin family protein [Methylocystis sp. MJC1]UZX13959.1 phasin family protein [Methylocystis sp. MJC1]